MTPQEREQLRLSLLRFLSSNLTRFGLPVSFLLAQARMEGRSHLSAEELDGELAYLEDKKLVTQAWKAISPELRNFRITAEGRDYLAAMNVD